MGPCRGRRPCLIYSPLLIFPGFGIISHATAVHCGKKGAFGSLRMVHAIVRCCASRQLLCSWSFPLCLKDGGCICHFLRVPPLISINEGCGATPSLKKGPFFCNICKS